ncbi:MAG TPA: hypothetical protein VGL18_02745 [Actinomycetota bacterium]|jgi:hypothetical protein
MQTLPRWAGAIALSAGFPAATWLVGGMVGLITGLVIVVLWWGMAPRLWVIWALSVVLLAIAPITVVLQGLPQTSVVGSGFGAEHLLAHRVVSVSLELAAFAGLVELAGLQSVSRSRTRRAWRTLSGEPRDLLTRGGDAPR